MKKRTLFVFSVLIILLLFSVASAGENAHWGYLGDDGPDHWSELDPDFSACSTGKNQSPIDLSGMTESDLLPINVDYLAGGYEIVNNGHSIQINYRSGSTIAVEGHKFELKQFHFHSPSENTIEGYSYPMEAHFVHADKTGNLAVISVMFKTGMINEELEKGWSHMPDRAGDKIALSNIVDAKKLLPHKHDYYRFNGSLTTPPCSEGVWWLVMKYYITASKEQIDKFVQTMGFANNRPVQPVNARMILK